MARAIPLALLWRSVCILFLTASLGANATSLSFFYNFSHPTTFSHGDLNFDGDAYAGDGSIILAKERLTGNASSRSGQLSYKHPVRLRSNATAGEVSGFSASFCFVINGSQTPIDTGGGLALFLAPYPSRMPPNSEGGYLGLFNSTMAAGGNQIVAVEVDSHGDLGWDPTMSPHIGVDLNTLHAGKNSSYKAIDELVDGVPYVLQVDYSDVTKDLVIVLRDSTAGAPLIALKTIVDLSMFLPPEVTIGISAATGGSNTATHHVLWWSCDTSTNRSMNFSSLTSAPDVPGTLVVPDSPPPADTDPPSAGAGRYKRTVLVAIVVATVLSMVTATVVALLCLLSRSTVKGRYGSSASLGLSDDLLLPTSQRESSEFHQELLSTQEPSDVRLIGEGMCRLCTYYFIHYGFAFVEQLRHRNLLRVQRWTRKLDRISLVYEHVSNGRLSDHLLSPGGRLLTWPMRHQIALGVGSALEYLHGQPRPMPHGDVRTDNVMLDESFNAKLGGFGMAPCFRAARRDACTDDPWDSEVLKESMASDVHRFGALLLEVVCGRRGHHHLTAACLVDHVMALHGRGAILDAADERLNGEFPAEEVERVLLVGLWCAHPDRRQRPSMTQAMKSLRPEAPLPRLAPRMPDPVPISFT